MKRERILATIFSRKKKKAANPFILVQIVGYILTEDPAYIANHNGAGKIILRIDEEESLKDIVVCYFEQ